MATTKPTQEQIEAWQAEVDEAAGDYAATDDKPCGLVSAYEEDEPLPWRIYDDVTSEYYATPEEAVKAAAAWAEAMED